MIPLGLAEMFQVTANEVTEAVAHRGGHRGGPGSAGEWNRDTVSHTLNSQAENSNHI